MNYATKFGWNPLLPRLEEFSSLWLCSVGEASPAGGDGGGAPPGGTPASSDGSSDGSTDGSSGAGDAGDGTQSSGVEAFSGMDDFDSIDLGDVSATTTEVVPPQTETPAATPPAQTPAATPSGAPPAEVPPVATVPPTTPSVPRSAREELSDAVDGFKANFNELVGWAQGELFKLSPEEIDALDTNAVDMIPKLMARCYTQAVMASANIMRNFSSRMIEEGFAAQSAKTARATEAQNEFYKSFPTLNPKDHDKMVAQYAKTYRSMNPKASRADAIKFVGNAVLAHFGLSAAPAAASPPGGGPGGRTPPFQPARPGGRTQTPPTTDDPYSGLDVDFLDVG